MTTIYVSCYAIGKNSLNEFSENICDKKKDCQGMDPYTASLQSVTAQRWGQAGRLRHGVTGPIRSHGSPGGTDLPVVRPSAGRP